MNESKGTRYRRRRRRTRATGAGVAAVGLAALALTPASAALADRVQRAALGLSSPLAEALTVTLFVLAVVVIVEAVWMPFRLHLAHLDRQYGEPVGPTEQVLAAGLRAAAADVPVFWGLAVTSRLAMWVAGPWWWMATAATSVGVLAVAISGAPRLMVWFAGARAVSRPALRRRLASLASRARVPIGGVEELPVGPADRTTAFVSGAGPSRRVFVASTLVRDWTDDEVSVVVAHELGHHVHRDLWRTLALDGATLAAALGLADVVLGAAGMRIGLAGPTDLAALPLLAVVAGAVWIAALPIRHAQSRHHEQRADAFALALTNDADAFGAVIRRLGERHLAEERPSVLVRWLSYRHPSIGERLALAEAHRVSRLESPMS